MKDNTYTNVTQMVNPINQPNKYKAFIEKLVQKEPNDWLKFLQHLKKLHSAAIYRVNMNWVFKKASKNTHTITPNIYIQNHNSPTKINAVQGKSLKSPFYLSITIIDISGKICITNSKPNTKAHNEKPKHWTKTTENIKLLILSIQRSLNI